MNVGNLRIGTRLGFGFGVVLLLLIILAAASLSRMANIHNSLDKVINENNVVTKELNDMRQAVMLVAVAVRNMSVMTTEDEVLIEVKQISTANTEYAESTAALATMIRDDAGKAMLDKIAAAHKATTSSIEKAIQLAKRQGDVIPILVAEVVPKQRTWLNTIDELIKHQEKPEKETSVEAGTSYDHALILTLAPTGVALGVGAFVAWYVTRSIVSPLRNAVQVARKVADGDLTAKLHVDANDETGQLLAALRDMNASLVRIVSEVRNSTNTITTASEEIAHGNMDLSARTETQASSLQMTASTMEELTTTVKNNAQNAMQASKLAATASDVALRGGNVVSQVVHTMGSINDSAKKIVDIIGVIDGIAFQTNILALNAAVEAARAGEQGRGFAVVAAEVRNLAQRSAGAAKEIKALISDSVEKVGAGAKLVDQAGSTMDEVVTSVRHVTEIITEIATASQEQTSGIEQINQTIIQMDNVTQQNAALVEEAAAAASALQEQANHLSVTVGAFKMNGGEMGQVQRIADLPKPVAQQSQNIRSSPQLAIKKAPALKKANSAGGNGDWEEF